MPKEVIDTGYVEIKVVWNRETGSVQIATLMNDITLPGWYADLDEDSLDRLIKILKRVKRQIKDV